MYACICALTATAHLHEHVHSGGGGRHLGVLLRLAAPAPRHPVGGTALLCHIHLP